MDTPTSDDPLAHLDPATRADVEREMARILQSRREILELNIFEALERVSAETGEESTTEGEMSHFRSGRSEIYVYSSDDTYTWVAVGCSALFGLARSPELFEYVAINSDHGVTIGDEFVTVTLRLVEEQDDQVTLQLTHRIPAVHFITWTTDPPKSLVYSSLISVAVLAVSRAAASLVTRLQPRFGGSTWYAD